MINHLHKIVTYVPNKWITYVLTKDIVNSAFNLGESIAESKIVRKILRFLPERFHAKITVIEEVKDIDQIPLTELVGNLQT